MMTTHVWVSPCDLITHPCPFKFNGGLAKKKNQERINDNISKIYVAAIIYA